MPALRAQKEEGSIIPVPNITEGEPRLIKTYFSSQEKVSSFYTCPGKGHKPWGNTAEAWNLLISEACPSKLLHSAFPSLSPRPAHAAGQAMCTDTQPHAQTHRYPPVQPQTLLFGRRSKAVQPEMETFLQCRQPAPLGCGTTRRLSCLKHDEVLQMLKEPNNHRSAGLISKSFIFKSHRGLRLENSWKSLSEVMLRPGRVCAEQHGCDPQRFALLPSGKPKPRSAKPAAPTQNEQEKVSGSGRCAAGRALQQEPHRAPGSRTRIA